MKKLETIQPNFAELNAKELQEINGGVFGIDDVIIGLVVAAGAAIINDWDGFKAGFKKGWNAA